jgi:transcriptional regulator of acetoin/glycerol metabolism
VLEQCNGVIKRAAQKANIPRQSFHRLLRKLGLGYDAKSGTRPIE